MKACFKCNIEKPLSDYYKHKQMGDGHLNKCKVCTKNDVSTRENKLRNESPEWVKQERKRGRNKYYRLGCKKPSPDSKSKTMIKYKEKFPEKHEAKLNSGNLSPKIKGNQLHHWSYNKIHFKDCIELSAKEHMKLHRYMFYDQEFKMYRDFEGNLLDTKEKHLAYYETLKDKE